MGTSERVKRVIEKFTHHHSRYVHLEALTGIKASVWKNFWFGRKKLDAEMIAALCCKFPDYCFWIITGEKPSSNQEHKCL